MNGEQIIPPITDTKAKVWYPVYISEKLEAYQKRCPCYNSHNDSCYDDNCSCDKNCDYMKNFKLKKYECKFPNSKQRW